MDVRTGRDATIDWIALHILPHEADVRAWLRRAGHGAAEVDDLIQETYCRIACLDSVAHIRNGRAYFYTTARSILLQRIRRERVVKIESVTDIALRDVMDEEPSPERVAGARRELKRVLEVIAALPSAYRQVIELRRIHALSQKETARRLGVTEAVVENNSVRGLRMVLKALAQDSGPAETGPAHPAVTEDHDRTPTRQRH